MNGRTDAELYNISLQDEFLATAGFHGKAQVNHLNQTSQMAPNCFQQNKDSVLIYPAQPQNFTY